MHLRQSRLLPVALVAAGIAAQPARALDADARIVKVTRETVAARPDAGGNLEPPKLVKFDPSRDALPATRFSVFWHPGPRGLPGGTVVVVEYVFAGETAVRRQWRSCDGPVHGPQRTEFEVPESGREIAVWAAGLARGGRILAAVRSDAAAGGRR